MALAFLAWAPTWAQSGAPSGPGKPRLLIPPTKISQTVLSHTQVGEKPYLSFPCLLRLNEQEILITFKRGTSHGTDRQADSDVIRFNTVTDQVLEHKTIGSLPDQKYQLTLPVRLPSGAIAFFADLQHQGHDNRHYRDGMLYATSPDQGKTVGTWKKLPLVDGVEYGYPLDALVEGNTVYLLAMSFGYRPGGLWSVAVLRSDDGAKSWKRVQNITEALGGGPINESCFVRVGSDFLVVCRGYLGQETRLARFDQHFKLKQVVDLTGPQQLIGGYIGWPRIFYRDNRLYVMGRMWPGGASYQVPPGQYPEQKNGRLGLLRIQPESLAVEQLALLDNEEGLTPIKDGYYAAPYWQKKGDEVWFNAVTYRAIGTHPPDIIRLAFRWDEVK
ncbi:hypothetical protein GCM10027275_11060 [Rhabdobacter roseus]|uniref:Exo-alpha-sialidase n=1 Tax=Rhabdobacter roseus TaxID=1655419 RepID=A0A840TFU1_9BACT|nr:sialidase family protein [Rhabdobacter roseus]MBB5283016.1 hypothetical protein [Rhabdobacter roseus]